jgi:hypothetical protein
VYLTNKRCVIVAPNPDRARLKTKTIAKAVANRTVPNIVGMALAAAQSACTAVQLGLTTFGDTSTTVVTQSPIATTVVPANSSVDALFGSFPELIVNGTFNTDISGWTDISQAPSIFTWSGAASGMLRCMSAATHAGMQQQVIILPGSLGKLFVGSMQVTSFSTGGSYVGKFAVGTIANPTKYVNINIGSAAIYPFEFHPDELTIVVTASVEGDGSLLLFDNITMNRSA